MERGGGGLDVHDGAGYEGRERGGAAGVGGEEPVAGRSGAAGGGPRGGVVAEEGGEGVGGHVARAKRLHELLLRRLARRGAAQRDAHGHLPPRVVNALRGEGRRMGGDLLGELGGEALDFAREASVHGQQRLDAAMLDEAIAHLAPLSERRRQAKKHLRVHVGGDLKSDKRQLLGKSWSRNLQGVQ